MTTKQKLQSKNYVAGIPSDVKMKLFLPPFEYKQCISKFKTMSVELGKTQICAGGVEGKDACNGDSGGPLMTVEGEQWYQDGIVSFGHKCGQAGWPGVYTQVSKFVQWIKKAMKKAKRLAKAGDKDLLISTI